MGTELTYPYLKGGSCLMINVEELSAYLKRNQKIQESKIKQLMKRKNMTYREVIRDLLENQIPDDREVD